MPYDNYPIPENMEGQRTRSPYSRFNTMFNPRLLASDIAMGALPGPTGIVDRMTGNNIRNQVDRLTGATNVRNQRDYDAYMREMMRNDPGNRQNGLARRFRDWIGGLFNRDEGGGNMPSDPSRYNPYMAPTRGDASGAMWGTGGPVPTLGFQQYMGPSMTPQPLYGTGQGMMRNPPAPLYGTGQGMMRAPEQAAPSGDSGGGMTNASGSGGGANKWWVNSTPTGTRIRRS